MLSLNAVQAPIQGLQKGSKTRIRFLVFSTVIVPFVSVFGSLAEVFPLLEGVSISSYLNYICIVGALIILQAKRFSLHKYSVIAISVLLFMLIMNYGLTTFASSKWLINWLGFILIGAAIVGVLAKLSKPEFIYFEFLAFRWIYRLSLFFAFIVAIAWFSNLPFLLEMLAGFKGDQVNAILTTFIGTEKQSMGIFFLLFIFSLIIFWSSLSFNKKILLIMSLLLFLPNAIFIRTLNLALFLLAFWLLFNRNKFAKLLGFMFGFVIVGFVLSNWAQFILLVEGAYDRLPSLMFAWSAMTEYVFGLGNGGYHIYVEQYNDQLVNTFGSEYMLKFGSFWAAPESDLAYFIASWGVLSIVFFVYFAVLLTKGAALFIKSKKLFKIERIILLMSFSMVFSGISQDNAGSLIWWIYIAAGSGVILRHIRDNKMEKVMQQRYVFN